MEGCSKISLVMSRELWKANYGRLLFGSEILWNKQMDRKNENKRTIFGPTYLHFEKNFFQNFDSENHDGPSQSFDYSHITFDEKCKDQLSEAENRFLIGLGPNFQ